MTELLEAVHSCHALLLRVRRCSAMDASWRLSQLEISHT